MLKESILKREAYEEDIENEVKKLGIIFTSQSWDLVEDVQPHKP